MANVYQMVTDRITEQLEKGIIPWRQPWMGSGAMAIGYMSRKAYSPLNQFLLGKPGEWLTWKQIQEKGGHVKKGAKSHFVVFYQWVAKKVEDTETHEIKDESYPILKWYSVFHIDDTEGIESKCEPVEANPNLSPIDAAEAVINGYLAREKGLRFYNDKESGSAYYCPSTDEVVVPMLSQYEIAEEYYSTTFHELVHSTGHEKRCNRKEETKLSHFGNKEYSREELVAEIGSAMLCNRTGIEVERAFKNSVAYIQSWLKSLKNDNKMIVWASGRAEKAARYIIGEDIDIVTE